MSSVHLTPQDARLQIDMARIPLESELVNGLHFPHAAGEKVVMAIMERTGQTEFDPFFDSEITEVIATDPVVVKPVEAYHNSVWEGADRKPDLDSLSESRAAWRRHGDFLRDVRSKEPFLNYEKQSLERVLVRASRHQGFPLNPEQIHARLQFMKLGYTDVMNSADSSGFYHSGVGHAMVDLGKSGLQASRVNIIHELFHSLSAHRYVDRPTEVGNQELPVDVMKVGFHQGSEVDIRSTGRWMNEALTQILSEIFEDPRIHFVQFDHPTATMEQIANGVIPEILGLHDDTRKEDDDFTYTDEKIAFLNAFADIPFRLLVRAYFLQDKDTPSEGDYSGAMAEKELWREIKRSGGTERIKQLRAIQQAFETDKPAEARRLALGMKQQSRSFRASLKRGVYTRQVARNTKDVQKRIHKARSRASQSRGAAHVHRSFLA